MRIDHIKQFCIALTFLCKNCILDSIVLTLMYAEAISYWQLYKFVELLKDLLMVFDISPVIIVLCKYFHKTYGLLAFILVTKRFYCHFPLVQSKGYNPFSHLPFHGI